MKKDLRFLVDSLMLFMIVVFVAIIHTQITTYTNGAIEQCVESGREYNICVRGLR